MNIILFLKVFYYKIHFFLIILTFFSYYFFLFLSSFFFKDSFSSSLKLLTLNVTFYHDFIFPFYYYYFNSLWFKTISKHFITMGEHTHRKVETPNWTKTFQNFDYDISVFGSLRFTFLYFSVFQFNFRYVLF